MVETAVLKVGLVTATTIGSTYLFSSSMRDMMFQGMKTPPAELSPPIGKVSVIMKNLDEDERIERAIKSLMEQSLVVAYPDMVEFILVDGGSTDKSLEIASQYPFKILHAGRGILKGKNLGILESTGDIIVFTDSDGYYPPYWLEKLVRGFDDEEVILVHTSTLLEEGQNILAAIGALYQMFNGNDYANGQVQAFRRWFFEENGLFDENYDCVNFSRVSQEEERNVVTRARQYGRVLFQPYNPNVSNVRRFNVFMTKHECIRNPQNAGCKWALEQGVTRI